MRVKKTLALFCLSFLLLLPLTAQTHTSVPLDNQIYLILEHAEARGLCSPLSGVRPYTQSVIVRAINEILDSDARRGLNATEREILEQYLARFSRPTPGVDLQRGAFYGEASLGEDNIISLNVGVSADIQGSAGIYSTGNQYWGTEIWAEVFVSGDLGGNFSYGFDFVGGLVRVPRRFLGQYNTYYATFENVEGSEFINELIDVHSTPLTHFPYTYKKRWDGSVYFFDSLNVYRYWPDSVAGAYSLLSEVTGSFLDDKLILRMGRISHDWGSVPIGSSLAFNQMARPFVALEAEFNPVPWFGIASLTGVLEYYNVEGIYVSPWTNQNAFSITMFQFRYKNYLFFDYIDSAIWPKRYELAYAVPIANNFFSQNNIGKFDNMAKTFNLRAQYPGLGSIWFSLFIDEINLIAGNINELDRTMIAWQAGLNIPIPVLSFSSLKLSYTKINPYCYTHHRNRLPWYGDLLMEKAYTNNGVGLGYYTPPNSDEILVRFNTMPAKNLIASLQYQLIRRGADHGPSAVDGSHLLSELDPNGRGTNPILRRYFLRDGAYQWQHIVRVGGEWNLAKAPLAFYGEAGTVISYFTNIEAEANVTGQAHSYSRVDTPDYPKATGFIMKFGVRVFPRN
jgi:hypothetical protein